MIEKVKGFFGLFTTALDRGAIDKVLIALMVAAVSWLFVTSLRVDPVVLAVGELKAVMLDNQRLNKEQHDETQAEQREYRVDNAQQHSELSMLVYNQGTDFKVYKAKLHRVMEDCSDNHQNILACQRFHDKRIYDIPFDILLKKDTP